MINLFPDSISSCIFMTRQRSLPITIITCSLQIGHFPKAVFIPSPFISWYSSTKDYYFFYFSISFSIISIFIFTLYFLSIIYLISIIIFLFLNLLYYHYKIIFKNSMYYNSLPSLFFLILQCSRCGC